MTAGLLLLDKPAGISSAAAIAVAKRRLGIKKIGHAGTLDPNATGLLICLIGGATRLAGWAAGGRKTYTGVIRFGLSTDTEDIWGNIVATSEILPPAATVAEKARALVGTISQVPPAISAIKINGERAYKLARRGENVELRARQVQVEQLNLTPLDASRYGFEVCCSSGTYVRSLARDLGLACGSLACIESLRRIASTPFEVSSAVLPDQAVIENIRPLTELFPNDPGMRLDAGLARRLRAGDERALRELATLYSAAEASERLYFEAQGREPLGLLRSAEGAWEFAINF
ncbi:MAG: tRNA pseudouridine(55) synthase TruB [Oligoflexia bacterium]|nr:tRNA pseudouridine(55) synthase TruB [Oligoflexia bacterium]